MSENSSGRGRDAAAIILLILIGIASFADVLFAGRHIYYRDLTRFYYPTKRVIREAMLSGEIPYWNRYYSAGQPMAANPEYEVFYPLQWLILLPDYDLGYRLHIVVHVLLGLVGMFLLLRSLSLSRAASFLGAISFGCGGLYLSLLNLLPILFAAVWIPFILMHVRRLLIRPSFRDWCLAALYSGMQLLVSEPTTMLQTWFLIGVYILYRGWHAAGRRLRVISTASLLVGSALMASIAVGGVQFLPAIDHAADSVRSRKFDFSLVTGWSMPPVKGLELIYPNVLGHLARENVMWYWGGGLYPNMGSPFLFNIYCGLLITAMVVAAMALRPRGSGAVLAIVATSTILAIGSNTPLYRWLYDAEIARSIRYPEKFALMGVFSLIVLGAITLDRLLEGDDRIRQAASGFCVGTSLVAALAAVLTFTPWYGQIFRRLTGFSVSANLTFMLGLSRTDWIVAAGRGALLAVLLWLVSRTATRRAGLIALTVFVLADLTPIGLEVNPRFPRSFFTAPPATATLDPAKETYRIFHEADWYGNTDIAKRYFGTGKGVYWVVRNGLFPMTTASWGFRTVLERDYDKTALLPTVDLVEAMWRVKRLGGADWAEPFMNMSNARYRTEYRDFSEEKKRAGSLSRLQAVSFKDEGPVPRYYFAGEVEPVRGTDDLVAKLTAKRWSDRVAFVETTPLPPTGEGAVLEVSETWNSAAIEVDASTRALLVMSVTPHKYWSAWIDGEPARLQRVNIGYQGIVVPAGRHRVEMIYENPIVRTALPVSAGAMVFLIGAAVLARREERVEAAP